MSGVAGAFLLPSSNSKETVLDRLKHMLPKLALRGQAGFGVVGFMHNKGVRYARSSRSPCQLSTIDYDEPDLEFKPHVAIAHVHGRSPRENEKRNNQPFQNHRVASRYLTIAVDGALVNSGELREELLSHGDGFSGDTDAELLLRLIEHACETRYWRHSRPVDYGDVFREIDSRIDGAISALLMDGEGNLVGFRNRCGLRPLEFMRTDDGFLLLASENCAFGGLKGKIEQILPGHIKYVDGKMGRCVDLRLNGAPEGAKLCAYEALYLGSPETSVHGRSHLETRYNIGVALGQIIARRLSSQSGSGPIIVCSMPHTGGPYADGLFASLVKGGVLADRLEIIATQSSQRTLLDAVSERKSLIARKYRVAGDNVTGRTIVIADEALIRGDTSRAVTEMLLAGRAKAVHWAIGSPPIVAPNYYGMQIDTIEELAFWQIWKRLPPGQRKQCLRFHNMKPQALGTIEKNIAAAINASSVTHLPFSALVKLLPRGGEGVDLSPFTFEMPTPAGQQRADRNLSDLMSRVGHSE
ncbi:class II glutamine amidotransferase [Bradyrhizobium sp. ARR65]|uniref:class II glutamine amidotransferase n=1 Tax=Bradyrhizobium sp. ARR65 TaxID=1040989 RepID=UPI000B2653AF|nr:class II glutamine amidotransferase [Bradyrhizobium sp. ARR65]